MNSKLAFLVLPAMLLAACAPAPAPAPTPAPPAAAAPPPPPPAPEAAAPAGPLVIRTLSCADLLSAADDDRAAASMFIIGYRAALTHTRALAINQIEGIEEAALQNCAANPKLTAIAAFGKAFAARGK